LELLTDSPQSLEQHQHRPGLLSHLNHLFAVQWHQILFPFNHSVQRVWNR
jgi:hypothetical protein